MDWRSIDTFTIVQILMFDRLFYTQLLIHYHRVGLSISFQSDDFLRLIIWRCAANYRMGQINMALPLGSHVIWSSALNVNQKSRRALCCLSQ